MKDSSDKHTIELIINNDNDNEYYGSSRYIRSRAIMDTIAILFMSETSKTDLRVLTYILKSVDFGGNILIINFDINTKLISELSGVSVTNVYRAIKNLERYILTKNADGTYKIAHG